MAGNLPLEDLLHMIWAEIQDFSSPAVTSFVAHAIVATATTVAAVVSSVSCPVAVSIPLGTVFPAASGSVLAPSLPGTSAPQSSPGEL